VKLLCTTFIIGLFIIALAPCRADVVPHGQKVPTITHRITLARPCPEFVFVVVRHRLHFANKDEPEKVAEYAKLEPGQPLEITGRHRRESVDLLVVSRETAAKYPSAQELIQADPPVVAEFNFGFFEFVPESHSDKLTINYRLVRTDDRFELERISWRSEKPYWLVAILLSIGVILGGLWLVRRLWRKGSAQA
jgi:hypothetical protein